ncbi:hypothetical protein [Glutamicibacter sp.]|uniref:hypothetical protein n=1 Tax=Glutamicibacter sp. TaxID=1931995 RepID=UPI0028BF0299|nr:hypothetical protein [Glutamicibacter sp.]
MGHSERQLKTYLGDRFGGFCEYMFGKTLGVCYGSSCDEAHGQLFYWGNVHNFLRLLKRRDQHDLDDDGSWVINTESETFYLLRLDGDEKTIVSLAVDTGHMLPDGRHTLRCDGDAFPLESLVDPPIESTSWPRPTVTTAALRRSGGALGRGTCPRVKKR